MAEQATSWPGYRWFRLAFMVIGIVMAALYFYDATTTGVVAPNVIKGSLWVLLIIVTAVVDARSRRGSGLLKG